MLFQYSKTRKTRTLFIIILGMLGLICVLKLTVWSKLKSVWIYFSVCVCSRSLSGSGSHPETLADVHRTGRHCVTFRTVHVQLRIKSAFTYTALVYIQTVTYIHTHVLNIQVDNPVITFLTTRGRPYSVCKFYITMKIVLSWMVKFKLF